jgi:hypothetical protein
VEAKKWVEKWVEKWIVFGRVSKTSNNKYKQNDARVNTTSQK